jgi:hypothetical protein
LIKYPETLKYLPGKVNRQVTYAAKSKALPGGRAFLFMAVNSAERLK